MRWPTSSSFGLARPLSAASPDLTPRALILGSLIGCLLCFTNLYFGLQTGWISMMTLQSALIGFLVSRLFPTPLTPQENVVVQTTAGATGSMPLAAGFVGIIPALAMLEVAKDGTAPITLSWFGAVVWSCAVAYFGVFMSPPLRKQVIVEEQLAFPSGTATAQLISVLHNIPPPTLATSPRRRKGYSALDTDAPPDDDERQPLTADADADAESESQTPTAAEHGDNEPDDVLAGTARRAGWAALSWSFAASGALTLFAYFFPVLFALPLFGRRLAKNWMFTFSPSLSYVGQGIIMGFPTTLSMNLGMLTGWAVLAPLAKTRGWAPGPVGDMSSGARGWILWPSLAIMLSDALVSLLPVVWDTALKLYRPFARAEGQGEAEDGETETETQDRLVPRAWVAWGLGASVALGTALVCAVFGRAGVTPLATLVGFAAGALLSILGVRALGETDLNPVSGLGKISQLLFAVVQPGNVVANIIAGGVAEAGAMQAGELMQDLKTGHLLHASPRAQFFAQLLGSSVSIVVTVTAYTLYTRAYAIPGPTFPAPTAYVWLGLARLLRDGDLPPHSGAFMLGAALLAGALSAIKTLGARRGARWASLVPSGVAFAIGFLNAPAFSLARLLGGLVELAWRRRMRGAGGKGDMRLIIVASGFVLGEGVVSVFNLVLRTFGVGTASCWGCAHGLCGGCPA